MKLPESLPTVLSPMLITSTILSQKIKIVKECLKQEFTYTGEEEARLKRELRDLYDQRRELNKGNGFGN